MLKHNMSVGFVGTNDSDSGQLKMHPFLLGAYHAKWAAAYKIIIVAKKI